MKKTNINVVSLFSGAGGMDLGFVNAGFNVIWANDNFPDAVETYKNNIGSEIICNSIENINLNSIPEADIVIGGFPCQGFSVANMKRTIDDERNVLYKYFVKIVALKKPSVFIAENVKGLLNIGGGEVIRKIISDFSNVGYNVKYKLLNAADYGVPQSRERVIIIGTKKDLSLTINFPHPTHNSIPNGKLLKHISIKEALNNIPDPDSYHDLKNHVYTKYKPKFNGYISNRKVNPHKPSPTITARGDNKGGAMIMNHPFKHRRLSCRELAVLQGFPINYEFYGSMTSVYRQIGNAVPPIFAEAIANNVKKSLLEEKEREAREIESIFIQPDLSTQLV